MRAQGYAYFSDPDNGIKEADTITCCHCNSIVHFSPNKKIETVSDFCRNCMKMHCLKQECFTCVPFLKKIEAEEAKYHARRSYG